MAGTREVTKMETAMHRVLTKGREVRFRTLGLEPERGISVPLNEWRNMGEPEVITVTIEPGDRLNP